MAGGGGWGPPPGYPPNMRGPGYPPPRRSSLLKRVLVVFLLIALAASLLLNVASLGLVGSNSGPVQTTVRSPGNSSEQIVVMPIEGLIDEACEARMERYLDRAQNDSDVKAVVLLIDTPGGTVTASDEIYMHIKKFKADKGVPIVVAMRGMATSGGYYTACAADYICAERTTLTGNIGVLWPRYNFSKLMDKYGVEDKTTVATGATYKDAGSPTRASTPQDEAYLQQEVDDSFAIFKKVVTDGRGTRLKGNIDDIANGKAYSGEEAHKLGLVDEIDTTGYLDAAVAYATKQASLTKPEVVLYHDPPPSLLNLLSMKYGGGQPAAGGVTINVDPMMLDRMMSPRMMYLYRGPR
jgi:protease-4